MMMAKLKLPITPAQRTVYCAELRRFRAVEEHSRRLRLITDLNIKFSVEGDLFCVYVGDYLAICVGLDTGSDYLVRSCLSTMYRTLGIIERRKL